MLHTWVVDIPGWARRPPVQWRRRAPGSCAPPLRVLGGPLGVTGVSLRPEPLRETADIL
jgi:hypothetical protein